MILSFTNAQVCHSHNAIKPTTLENEIYNLSGAKVYTGSDAEVSLNGGMYIVKVGDKVVKIAI